MWRDLSNQKDAALRHVSLEASAARWCVPYVAHVNAHTLRTQDGSLVQVIQLGGLPFDTADADELDLFKRIRNQLWKTFSNSNLAVYHHLVRRRRVALPQGEFEPGGFAAQLNQAWCERLSQRKLYTNDIYISLLHKPGEGVAKRLDQMFRSLSERLDAQEREDYERKALQALDDALRSLLEVFKAYQPRRLGVTTTDAGVPCSELMRLYGFFINLQDRRFALPERPVAEILPVARTIFRNEVVELRHTARTVYAGMVSVKEYPSQTAATMYDGLLTLPFEFCATQSFRFEERARSEAAIKQQRNRLLNAGDSGQMQIHALDMAMEETKGEAGFGLHHHTLMVWDEDASAVAGKLATVDAELAEHGITSVREDVNLEAAFYAQLPGNFRFIARGSRISTKNFASFASCHNYLGGRETSIWGHAITVLPTASGTAYHFNLHVADRGNTLVLGPTGQGKTLTTSFLFAQSLKLGGRRVFLDKDRGMEIFVRAIGGDYFRIESQRSTGWNPLQLPDTPTARGFLVDWFESLLTDEGGEPVDATDRQRIRQIVASVFDLAPELRQLCHVAPMFGNAEQDKLAKRLLDWYDHPRYGRGQNAWVFDNPRNALDMKNPVVGFDMTYVLDAKQIRPAVLTWLFYVIETLLDGQPLAIFADEGWRLLDDEIVARRIENFEFVIRKNNGLLVFATQTPETVMQSHISAALKQQSETFILFPNPKAEEDVYRGYLGLNETQFDMIRNQLPMRPGRGWFLVKNSLGVSVCQLDMQGMDDHIAVLSGNKNTVTLLDQLMAEHGQDAAAWLPHFMAGYRDAGSFDGHGRTS
jgi:type IV secretion system protein VirB4